MRTAFISALLFSLAGMACAGTFSHDGGAGVSTIGPATSDDYPSLAAAARDFSSFSGGCTGDWTLLINTPTLTEPNNVAFGNATNNHQVTVKPNTGITAEITFTTTTVNPNATSAAFSGNWIIGCSAIGLPLDNMTTTSNFTIDGSNNGTSSRDLTIKNVAVTSETQLIRVVGGCQNTTIKNVILSSVCSGSQLHFDIEFTARKTAAALDYAPNGCSVLNCDLTALTGSNTQNVLFRQVSSGTLTPGVAMDNVNVSYNTIKGIQNAINLGLVANATVNDNVLSMTSTLTSRMPIGIQHNLSNGTSGWTVNIARNKFLTWDNVSTPTTSGLGPQVELDSGLASPKTGTYNVYNNFFGGCQFGSPVTVTTGAAGAYRLLTVKCSVTTCVPVVHVYHNSFKMPNVSNMSTVNHSDLYHCVGINSTAVGNGFYGSMDVKDNIFDVEQNNAVAFFRTNTAAGTGTFVSDYNTFFLGSAGAKMGTYLNTTANLTPNYATLDNWQAAGFDTHSVIVNPNLPAAAGLGKWMSNSDLHFDGDPGYLYVGTPVGITTDFDNQSRSTTAPVKGADELPISTTAAQDWSMFQ